jgi:hypothetical protein
MISENRTSLTWTAPTVAVDPANHFYALYLRLPAISDALMTTNPPDGTRF